MSDAGGRAGGLGWRRPLPPPRLLILSLRLSFPPGSSGSSLKVSGARADLGGGGVGGAFGHLSPPRPKPALLVRTARAWGALSGPFAAEARGAPLSVSNRTRPDPGSPWAPIWRPPRLPETPNAAPSVPHPLQKRRPPRRRRKVRRRTPQVEAGQQGRGRGGGGDARPGRGRPGGLSLSSSNSLSPLSPPRPPRPRAAAPLPGPPPPRFSCAPSQPPRSRSRRQSEVTAAVSLPESDPGASGPRPPRGPAPRPPTRARPGPAL